MTTLPMTGSDRPPVRASVASPVRHWMARAGRSLYVALLASGQARACAELQTLADRWAPLHPALAAELRAACAHIAAS